MKQIIIVVAFLLSAVNVQAASWTVESQNKISGSKVQPSLLGMYSAEVTGMVGIYGFGMVMDRYVEAYAGPKFSLAEFAEVGVAAGLEQQSTLWRTNGYLWLGSGKISTFTTVEVGGKDIFYHSHVNYQIVKSLGIGAIAQRYAGVGPRIELDFLKYLKVWAAPVYNLENKEKGVLVSLRASF